MMMMKHTQRTTDDRPQTAEAFVSRRSWLRGPWPVARGPWSVVRGLWSAVRGLWSVVRGHCSSAIRHCSLLSLALALLLVYWLVGPAGRVVAGGDLFTYFYPYWAEASRAFQAGRLPLWNPYIFMGVPFLANSQAGVLYPLNWPFWLLLPPHRALHWSVLLHLWLAAAGADLYARRSLGLGRLGGWLAGATLALGGYLGAQFEHINQLQALSWFPWLLLLLDAAPSPLSLATLLMSLVVALVLLAGHTQSAFILLVGLALYGVVSVLWGWRRGGGWKRLAHRAGAWAVAVILGAALAAAQLLPTAELTAWSLRSGGLPFNERVSFSLSPVYLARALLPGYGRPVEPQNIEYVATVGVAGLALAFVAGYGTLVARRATPADERVERRLAVVVLASVGLFLALGLYNPLYLLLARFVPGFAHFRAPARWLALWAMGAASLAGIGAEALARGDVLPSRRAWVAGGAVLILLLLWGALGGQADPWTWLGWLAAALLVGGLLWLSRQTGWRRPAALALVVLTVGELALSARTLPHARATAPEAYTSLRPATAHLLATGAESLPADRFLSVSALLFDPGDLPELRLIYGDQLSAEALYALVIAAKHREVLSPNLPLAFGVPAVDGYDGGLLPLARYVAFQRAFLPEDEIAPDGRLRENLSAVPDGRWLSLCNVRWVITDKVFDAWIDGLFYDLQFGARLSGGETAQAADVPPFEATGLGLVSYLDGGAALPDGALVGQVEVGFADGVTRTFPLRAGMETAEGLYGESVAHAPAPVGGHFWPGQPQGNDYVTRLRWEPPAAPLTVTVRALLPQGQLVVRGLSLVDERTGSFQSLVISDRGRFRLAHSGDVKVYENLDVLPRAFLVHHAWAVDGVEQGLARLRAADFDPLSEVVVERLDPVFQPAPPTGPEAVHVLTYTAERVELEVDASAPGLLVLSDANYPGWQAQVDGVTQPVYTANLLFRAVALEPGHHQVTFVFRPPLLGVGGGISLAAALLWMISLLMIGAKHWRRFGLR